MKPVAILRCRFRDLKGIHVGVLGLTFKPGIDNTRQTPVVNIIPLFSDFRPQQLLVNCV
jgi:UDP-glucose 6-dehydrogenase